MGNSNGTLAEYWDAIEIDARAPGRVHLGVVGPRPRPDAARRHAALGLWRRLRRRAQRRQLLHRRPGLAGSPAEARDVGARALAAPVRIDGEPTDLAAGRVKVANRQEFRDLGWLRARYALAVDGDASAEARLELPAIAPGEPADRRAARAGAAGRLPAGRSVADRRVHDGAERAWAPAGLRGLLRVQLPVREAPPAASAAAAPAGGRRHGLARRRGRLVHPCSPRRPTLSLWRAPTDNDRIGGMGARWAAAGVDRLERRLVGVERDGGDDRRPQRVRDARRHRGPARAARTPPSPAAGSASRRRSTSRTRSPTWPGSGPSSSSCPGSRTLEWFGTGPARDLPRSEARRAGRPLESTVDRPVRALYPARRRTAATPTSAGSSCRRRRAAASGSTSTSRARCRRPTSAPPTSRRPPTTSSWCPARRRSSISTPPIGVSGRPAAAPTRCRNTSSGRHVPLVLDAPCPAAG